MLTGKFHSHITICPTSKEDADRAAAMVRGKVTFIDLGGGGRSQADHMITNHYVTGAGLHDAEMVKYALAVNANHIDEALGFKVLRVKLEHEITDRRTPPECVYESIQQALYTEVHVKILATGSICPMGWSLSRNALSVRDEVFITRRFVSHTLDAIKVATKEAIAIAATPAGDPLDIKYETCLVDTAPELDAWWSSSL